MNSIMARGDMSTADIEKAFIDDYYDYAALQGKEAWERAFTRAIVTDLDGSLNYTDGLNTNAFALEWCIGGETLGMNEEFVLAHGDISDTERARLASEGKCTVEVRDKQGNVLRTYEMTYVHGLEGTLKEMYHSGRITNDIQLKQIASYYKILYGKDI
jgi:hypothetical protein